MKVMLDEKLLVKNGTNYQVDLETKKVSSCLKDLEREDMTLDEFINFLVNNWYQVEKSDCPFITAYPCQLASDFSRGVPIIHLCYYVDKEDSNLFWVYIGSSMSTEKPEKGFMELDIDVTLNNNGTKKED